MKIVKRLIIAAVIIAVIIVGVSFALRNSRKNSVKAVEVVPVTNLNSSGYGFGDTDTVSGTIISKDTQSVELDSDHELKKVYVQEGDKVKKGDKLMEYDMEADQLKMEMEDLNRRKLLLSLEKLKKDLEILKSGRMPDYDTDDGDFDSYDSADFDLSDEDYADYEDEEDYETGSADLAVRTDELTGKAGITAASEEASGKAMITAEASDVTGNAQLAAAKTISTVGKAALTAEAKEVTREDGIVADAEDSSVVSDAEDGIVSDVDEDYVIAEDGDEVIDDGSGITGGEVIEDPTESATNIGLINEFIRQANEIHDAVKHDPFSTVPNYIDSINNLILYFQTNFGRAVQHQIDDAFGEAATITQYTIDYNNVDPRFVDEQTRKDLQQAYNDLCVWQFVYSVLTLNPMYTNSASWDEASVLTNEALLRSCVSLLYALPNDVFDSSSGSLRFADRYAALNDDLFAGETIIDFLKGLIRIKNQSAVVDPNPPEEDVASEKGPLLTDEFGSDFDDYGPDYTAEDIANAITEQEKSIKETELQIRESELEIKDYKRVLAGQTVYATMDGIVKSAGTVDAQPADGPFILITGKAGLYVQGTVNELSLDRVNVGDMISGNSYETGGTFTAEITEISPYPTAGNDNYWGFNTNSNASSYPFYAYIDNAEGLEPDSYVDLSLSNTVSTGAGLSLDEYYIRKDNNGRSYCYVEGEDGLLSKRYLELGANNWGIITIKSGLTPEDYIAFPYGKGVQEGAPTIEVDSLSAVNGEY